MRIALLQRSLEPFRLAFISIAATALTLSSLSSLANSQELRKAIRDYRNDQVFNYQPNDPLFRSKAYKAHTKHNGWFYNCDHQEDKRNSPYICWKPHWESDFPPCRSFREYLRRDIAEVRQRISDGAGVCQSSCGCRRCQTETFSRIRTACGHCGNKSANCACAPGGVSETGAISSFTHSPSYGLVSSHPALEQTALEQTSTSSDCLNCELEPQWHPTPVNNLNHSSPQTSEPLISTQSTEFSTATENDGQQKHGLASSETFQPAEVRQNSFLPQHRVRPPSSSRVRKEARRNEFIPRVPFETVEQSELDVSQTSVSPSAKNPAASSYTSSRVSHRLN